MTKKINSITNIFDFDLIIVPIFIRPQSHWSLAVFDINERIATYFYSLGCESILRLVQIEDIFNMILIANHIEPLSFKNSVDNSRLQNGGEDCDIFLYINSLFCCTGIDKEILDIDIIGARKLLAPALIVGGKMFGQS